MKVEDCPEGCVHSPMMIYHVKASAKIYAKHLQYTEHLEEILVSGLPEHDRRIDALYVRFLSRLVHSDGRIGLAREKAGEKEGRIYFEEFRKVGSDRGKWLIDRREKMAQIEWVSMANIESWIREHGWIDEAAINGYPDRMSHGLQVLRDRGVDLSAPFFAGWI